MPWLWGKGDLERFGGLGLRIYSTRKSDMLRNPLSYQVLAYLQYNLLPNPKPQATSPPSQKHTTYINPKPLNPEP